MWAGPARGRPSVATHKSAGHGQELRPYLRAKMVGFVPICLAEFGAIKGLALLALAIVAFLYWEGFQEKRIRRREQREAEQRRRQRNASLQ